MKYLIAVHWCRFLVAISFGSLHAECEFIARAVLEYVIVLRIGLLVVPGQNFHLAEFGL